MEINLKIPTENYLLSVAKQWYSSLYGVKFSDWNEELLSHSYPIEFFAISNQEIRALVSENPKDENLISLQQRLTKFLEFKQYQDVFVKLISRSPKDFLINKDGSVKSLQTSDEIINSLMSSMRCFEDSCHLLRLNLNHAITIRPYVKINPENEWRCYVKNDKLIGISQYHYNNDYHYKEEHLNLIKNSIELFVEKICIANIIVSNFIVDLVVSESGIKILETNPYGLSDPCLYKSYQNLEDCGIPILTK